MLLLIVFGILLSFFIIFTLYGWSKNLKLIKNIKLAENELSTLKPMAGKALKYLPEEAENIKKDLESALDLKTENKGSFSKININSRGLFRKIIDKSILLTTLLGLVIKFWREIYLTIFTAPAIIAVVIVGWDYMNAMGLIESSSVISQRKVFAYFVFSGCFLFGAILHAWWYFKNKPAENLKKKYAKLEKTLENQYKIKRIKLKAEFSKEEKELRGAIMLLDAEHNKRIEKAEKNSSLSDKQLLKNYKNS